MPEGTEPTIDQLKADVEYHKAEAKKAFAARDEVKDRIRALEPNVVTAADRDLFDRLKKEHADLEEQRRLKTGEFESAKKELETRHATEKKNLEDRLTATERKLRDRELDNAFFGATAYFGESGKTILPPDIARDSLGKYTEVQEVDLGDGVQVTRVVVKDTKGQVIRGSDGNPAPFTEAIGVLIEQLPNKDRLLRGSGKVGSGSSGGSRGSINTADLDTLTKRVQAGDKTAIAAMKQRQAGLGGMVRGKAFESTT
jgi:hypothetical protein